MNYCCETYASIYVNSCRYGNHGEWPHAGCEAYENQRRLLYKYRDLLMDGDVLRPKSDVCPFCKEAYKGRGGLVDQWVDLPDGEIYPDTSDRSRGERHTAKEPDMEAGAALVRRLRERSLANKELHYKTSKLIGAQRESSGRVQ